MIAAVLGALGLGGALAALVPFLSFLGPVSRFAGKHKKLFVVLGLFVAGAVAALTLWGIHQAKARAAIEAAEERGRSAEETKWRLEVAKLKAEQAVERQADETELRTIVMKLNDEKSARREQRDDFDRTMLELEQADAASGAAPNSFDPRVLQLVR